MYKAGLFLLLPLLLINITTSANGWSLLGINIGQFVYWIVIGLAWYVASRSQYLGLVTVALLLAAALRVMEEFGGGDITVGMRVTALAVIFVVAGIRIYGRNPFLLHKQLVIFLALSLPVMFLQILGVSSLLMGWNTEYAHDTSILDVDELGTFKDIPLFPTLFVGTDDIHYSIGQGRPVGLLYSNNVLSIFVSIAAGLNLVIKKRARLRMSDFIISGALILSMSKMAFAIAMLLYLGSLVFGGANRRLLALKLLLVLAIGMSLYCLFFPGLLLANRSESKIWSSFLLRALDIGHAIGFDNLGGLFYDKQLMLGNTYNEIESYSFVSKLLKSEMIVPGLLVMAAAAVLYAYRVRQMSTPVMVYVVTLLVCALTQFVIPYLAAPSFQFIAGFALFPLFKKMWQTSPAGRRWGWWLKLRDRPESGAVSGLDQ